LAELYFLIVNQIGVFVFITLI